uniref:Basic proline-rich protein-like isoform X2 n=1 Tax=Petromyzon marinus TaxID=7757 RepID=A0AAJ7XCQ8_PETMA|nr:basic proline-rich protein-like isoform X2 [Petromyzon marinus]
MVKSGRLGLSRSVERLHSSGPPEHPERSGPGRAWTPARPTPCSPLQEDPDPAYSPVPAAPERHAPQMSLHRTRSVPLSPNSSSQLHGAGHPERKGPDRPEPTIAGAAARPPAPPLSVPPLSPGATSGPPGTTRGPPGEGRASMAPAKQPRATRTGGPRDAPSLPCSPRSAANSAAPTPNPPAGAAWPPPPSSDAFRWAPPASKACRELPSLPSLPSLPALPALPAPAWPASPSLPPPPVPPAPAYGPAPPPPPTTPPPLPPPPPAPPQQPAPRPPPAKKSADPAVRLPDGPARPGPPERARRDAVGRAATATTPASPSSSASSPSPPWSSSSSSATSSARSLPQKPLRHGKPDRMAAAAAAAVPTTLGWRPTLLEGVEDSVGVAARIRWLHADALRSLTARCHRLFALPAPPEEGGAGGDGAAGEGAAWSDFTLLSPRPCCALPGAVFYVATRRRGPPGPTCALKVSLRPRTPHQADPCPSSTRRPPPHFNVLRTGPPVAMFVPSHLGPPPLPAAPGPVAPLPPTPGAPAALLRAVSVVPDVPRRPLSALVRSTVSLHRAEPERYERLACLLLLQLAAALEHLQAHGRSAGARALRPHRLYLAAPRPEAAAAVAAAASDAAASDAAASDADLELQRLLVVTEDEEDHDEAGEGEDASGHSHRGESDAFHLGLLAYHLAHLPDPFSDDPTLADRLRARRPEPPRGDGGGDDEEEEERGERGAAALPAAVAVLGGPAAAGAIPGDAPRPSRRGAARRSRGAAVPPVGAPRRRGAAHGRGRSPGPPAASRRRERPTRAPGRAAAELARREAGPAHGQVRRAVAGGRGGRRRKTRRGDAGGLAVRSVPRGAGPRRNLPGRESPPH